MSIFQGWIEIDFVSGTLMSISQGWIEIDFVSDHKYLLLPNGKSDL